jgi:hypothetical protein
MLAAAAVEMDACYLDSTPEGVLDLFESSVGGSDGAYVVTELARKCGGELDGFILLDGYAPQNLHFRRNRHDLSDFFDRVSSRECHAFACSPLDVLIFLYWV